MAEKKFPLRMEVDADLSEKDIDDIMVTALEGGITHWCGCAEVVGEYLGECASEQISRGGSLILHDAESSDKWELTLEKFLKGIKLYFELALMAELAGEDIDPMDLDAEAADCIIQYALFGEVVFG